MGRWHIHRPGRPVEIREADRAPTDDEAREIIGCRAVERAWVLFGGARAEMLVDETGAVGSQALINGAATDIYYAAKRAGRAGSPPDAAEGHVIYGPAIVLEGVTWG